MIDTVDVPLDSLYVSRRDGGHPRDYLARHPEVAAVVREACALVEAWKEGYPNSLYCRGVTMRRLASPVIENEVFGPYYGYIDLTLFYDPDCDEPDEDIPPIEFALEIPRDWDAVYERYDGDIQRYWREIREPAIDALIARLNTLFKERGAADLLLADCLY